MDRALQRRILRVLHWASAYIGAGMAQGVYEHCAVDPKRALEYIDALTKDIKSMDAAPQESDKEPEADSTAARSGTPAVCRICKGSGWLHGAQEWTPERMKKGTPYKSIRCECATRTTRQRNPS